MTVKPILHCHNSEFHINFSRVGLRCFWSVLQIGSFRGSIPECLKCTWFPSQMECSHGKPCENVVFGSKHGGLLRDSHRICKYLIHLWTHCSLQREILSLKLCFKNCLHWTVCCVWTDCHIQCLKAERAYGRSIGGIDVA